MVYNLITKGSKVWHLLVHGPATRLTFRTAKRTRPGNIPRHPVNGGCCIFRLDDGHEETSEREKSEMLVERHDQSSLPPANSSGESDDGGDMEVIQVEEKGRGWGRREQWDCESILR